MTSEGYGVELLNKIDALLSSIENYEGSFLKWKDEPKIWYARYTELEWFIAAADEIGISMLQLHKLWEAKWKSLDPYWVDTTHHILWKQLLLLYYTGETYSMSSKNQTYSGKGPQKFFMFLERKWGDVKENKSLLFI